VSTFYIIVFKTRKAFIILICFIVLTMEGVFANYAFKKKVKNVCVAYRVPVDPANMEFGDNLFSLSLESKRNDFEMVMLVGFASVGQAVSHQKSLNLANAYLPETIMVQVYVPISKGETMIFEASCPAEKAIALVEGRMDSSEFMQQLNMETL